MPVAYDDNTSGARAKAFDAVRAFVKGLHVSKETGLQIPSGRGMLTAIASYMYQDGDTQHIDCERRTAERHALGAIVDAFPHIQNVYNAAKDALAVRDQSVSERPYAQRQSDADGVMWYDPFLKPGEPFTLKVQAWNERASGDAARERGDKDAARKHYEKAILLAEEWEKSGEPFAEIDASHFIGHCQYEMAKLEGAAMPDALDDLRQAVPGKSGYIY